MITLKNIVNLVMNKIRLFIIKVFLFFGLIKDHPFTTEKIVDNKQKKRGQIISIIKDDSRK